jgi:UDP-N-acetylmuramate dehydrogenase
LATLTSLAVGGPPLEFVDATSDDAVVEALKSARTRELPVFVLGGGSNVVVADEGVPGLCLRMATRGLEFAERGPEVWVTAAAGENWDEFTRLVSERGLGGVECLGGIPGSVGATPIQNVGAYGQEVSDTIVRVRAVERSSSRVVEFDHADCRFGYRDSFFKSEEGLDRYVVLSVTYRLRPGRGDKADYPELSHALGRPAAEVTPEEARRVVIGLRRRKSMVLDANDENTRSCGSFFVNPQLSVDELENVRAAVGAEAPSFRQADGRYKVPAAWLIEQAGLHKGTRHGNVGLSSKHTLAIVAHESASAADVVRFARFVRDTVKARLGVTLTPEPLFWGFAAMERGLPLASTP